MAANDDKGESSHNAVERALDEAAFNMASLQLKPDNDGDTMLLDAQQLNIDDDDDNDNDTILLKAQFDLFKFLVCKAGAAAEDLLLTDPTITTLRADFEKLVELSNLIDRVERDDYHGTEDEERKLQSTLNTLVAYYVGIPEVDERIRAVFAVEKSVGYGGGGAKDEVMAE